MDFILLYCLLHAGGKYQYARSSCFEPGRNFANTPDHVRGSFPDTQDTFILSAKNTFRLLTEIETQGYDPWLSAWWQLKFQIVCQAWENQD
ncbi:MAG: hypothetical protein HUU50_14855 [Candidatus Brocadiae bacterium]|nr:hypothetical protein [Candidatus Brocadiia bacterium]